MKRALGSVASGVVLTLAGTLLPGCPLSDDYYVEQPELNTSDGGTEGGTLTTATTGSGTSSTGGNTTSTSSTGTSTTSTSQGSGGGTSSASASTTGSDLCQRCSTGDTCDPECETGWAAMAAAPVGFVARERAAYTATDSALFVWGGRDAGGALLNTGALYDMQSDSWTEISVDANTPSARHSATAVWTGSEVVVWGGANETALKDGARYDPATDSWTSMIDGPKARAEAPGAYLSYAGRVAFSGGITETGALLEGVELYDPVLGAWETGNPTGGPGKRKDATWSHGDRTVWIFGGLRDGSQLTTEGSYYSAASSSWVPLPAFTGAPRSGAFGAFFNLTFYVWGGQSSAGLLGDGYSYALSSVPPAWNSVTINVDPPTPRRASVRESGWSLVVSGTEMLIVGGLDAQENYLQDGGIYTSGVGWELIPEWPGSDSHAHAAVVFTAGELAVWGGQAGDTLTKQGLRYLRP